VKTFDSTLMHFLDSPVNVLAAAGALLAVLVGLMFLDQVSFYFRLIAKSLFRNVLRSMLTSLAVVVMVLVVTLIWTVTYTLDLVTTEKSADFKIIVTERWQIPSMMPYSYQGGLANGGARKEGDARPQDYMGWTFYGGTIDPANRTRDNIVFFFAMDPAKVMKAERDGKGNLIKEPNGKVRCSTMLDDMDQFTDEEIDLLDRACREMEKDPRKVIIGKERLALLKKKVGETMKVTSINYIGIDLEVEIIGEFPDGRYNQNAVVNFSYIRNGLDAWKQKNGKAHFMADKCLNLMWLKVPDTETFRRVADQVMESPEFTTPAVKCETASSGIASFLDAYRDLFWGVKWLFVPAILATMTVVIANAISISVRERRTEMAVLKVLGFRPAQVMVLVLGEAILIGALSGLLSGLMTYGLINFVAGGIKFPIAFFPAFLVPRAGLWWGLVIGSLTALFGSIVPAWSARSVRVAEVFSKIS
jgi:putative ABC transport system permease protein